jgi:hypothetical protein
MTSPYRENQNQPTNPFDKIPSAAEMLAKHENLVASWVQEGRRIARNSTFLYRVIPSILNALEKEQCCLIKNVYGLLTDNYSKDLNSHEVRAIVSGIYGVLQEEFESRGYETSRLDHSGIKISIPLKPQDPCES